ncbi:MAG: succinyl-diaminopimelate desuccinylase [Actinomycetes bacterium]
MSDAPDLLARTAELVDIPSVSCDEGVLVDVIEERLRALPHLEVVRLGDNLVARTHLDRALRVIVGGHTDTVPANGNLPSRADGDVLWGLGAADMKGGLAVMLALAERHSAPAVDVTYVFYAREEIAAVHSGLGELFAERPDLLAGDVAVLGEPTDGQIEAGCQGTIRATVTLRGERAHTARAWMGRNAIHRAGPLLQALHDYEPRRPVLSGCAFHEALLAVGVSGGVSGNVVPDTVEVQVAHRFAPDRSPSEAEQHLREVVRPFLDEHDTITIDDVAPAAPPAVDHPVVAALVRRHGLEVTAKLGWTDVARFAERGVPAINLGPGDPLLAHTADERVARSSLDRTFGVLDDLFVNGVTVDA